MGFFLLVIAAPVAALVMGPAYAAYVVTARRLDANGEFPHLGAGGAPKFDRLLGHRPPMRRGGTAHAARVYRFGS